MSTATTTDRGDLWWVYVIHCEGDRYYVGCAKDVDRRYQAHVAGKGALFTRSHPPILLLGALPVGTRSQAMLLERQVKRWTALRKEILFTCQQETWTRYGQPSSRVPSIYEELAAQVEAIDVLDAARVGHEDRIWAICLQVAPELIELLSKTGADAATAKAWLCSRNLQLAGKTPASLVASGRGAEVIALIVQAIHGV